MSADPVHDHILEQKQAPVDLPTPAHSDDEALKKPIHEPNGHLESAPEPSHSTPVDAAPPVAEYSNGHSGAQEESKPSEAPEAPKDIASEPVSESAPEASQEVAPEPSKEVVREPSKEVVREPSKEGVPEPPAGSVPEPTPEAPKEVAQEAAPEAAPEPVPEPVSEAPKESGSEAIPEPAPEAAPEAPKENAPESVSEAPKEPAPEASTAPAPEAPKEPAADATPAPTETLPLFTRDQQKHWSNALRNLKKNRNSPPFLRPVDWELLGIPDYPKFVTQPMDIGTIEKRLQATARGIANAAKVNAVYGAVYPGSTDWAGHADEADAYRTVFELKNDLDLIWNNCFTFNGPPDNNMVSKMAAAMQQAADRAWGATPLAAYVKANLTQEDVDRIAAEAAQAAEAAAKAAAEAAEAAARNRPRRASAPPPQSLVDPAEPTGGLAATAIKDAPGSLSQQRPRREIHAPARELPYLTNEVKRTRSRGRVSTEQYKFLRDVLREIYKKQYQEFAFVFYEPVDPIALNVPNYFEVIKQPMDLASIKAKVEQKAYPDPPYEPFEDDIRLMLSNAYTFNPPGTLVHDYARRFEDLFNRKWASRPTDFDESGSESEDSDPDNEVYEQMRRQLEELQNMIASKTANKKKKQKSSKKSGGSISGSSGAAAAPAPPKARRPSSSGTSSSAPKRSRAQAAGGAGHVDEPPKVTFEMKSELASKMVDAEPSKLESAVAVIRSARPDLICQNSGEIELDIDQLDDRTLFKLYQLICGSKKPKTASPPRESIDEIEQRRIAMLEDSLRSFDTTANQSRRSALESSDSESDDDSESD